MRLHLVLIILIGFFLLVMGANAAPIPDYSSSISSSSGNWVVVAHQTTIVIIANNMTSGAISGATVNVALNSTTLGSLTMNGFTTDATGQVNGTFVAGTKPGTVNITATITYNDGVHINIIQKTYSLNIDHDIPYNALYIYNKTVSVDTVTPFSISYTDIWGNPIDNRNPNDPDSITLHISSPNNQAELIINGTYQQTFTLQLDPNGNISVNVLTDTTGGENLIQINPFGNIGIEIESIIGITNGVPFSINQTVIPNNPASFPADGNPAHKFTFVYTLYDKFNNVAQNQTVLIHSNWPGDADVNITSNAFGQVIFNYGPHSSAGAVTITVTALSNTSVSASQVIQYYSNAPVSMVFTATPQTMASLDANSGQTSTLTAKVLDIMGNPVPNESVTFTMGAPAYDYAPCVISGPSISSQSATTDSNGNAIITFIPGTFDTNKANVTYDPSDTGNVVVTATWNTTQEPVQLSWKNYPYLSAKTLVNPQQVGVNNTISITISLTGDGWALTGKPADVIIVTDLAGGIGGPQLLAQTQPAEIGFIKNATNDTYIGLVTFGNSPGTSGTPYASNDAIALWATQVANPSLQLFNPYGSVSDYDMVAPQFWSNTTISNMVRSNHNYCFTPSKGSGQPCTNATNTGSPTYYWSNPYSDAKIVEHLMNAGPAYSANRNTLTSAVNSYVSAGGTDYAAGINAAMQELNTNGNPTHNQTIIIMGDGINMMAPIAHTGSEALESYWPSDWYPRPNLGYFDESDTGKAAGVDAATRAKNQGITIYGIGFSTPDYWNNLQFDQPFFTSMTSPGGFIYCNNTAYMSSIFQQIEGQIQNTASVNTTMTLNFQNVNVTLNNLTQQENGLGVFNYVYDPTASSTEIINQTGNITFINQTDEWLQHQTLTFNVGNMTVGQTWSATFEMQVNTPGNIDIFGSQSQLTFNGGGTMSLPKTYTQAIYNLTNSGVTMPAIQITGFEITPNSTITGFVPLQWNITYPGSQTVSETLYYSLGNNPYNWKLMQNLPPVGPGNWTQTASWDIRGLPSGTYYVELTANAPDATPDTQVLSTTGTMLGMGQKAYIKLE